MQNIAKIGINVQLAMFFKLSILTLFPKLDREIERQPRALPIVVQKVSKKLGFKAPLIN